MCGILGVIVKQNTPQMRTIIQTVYAEQKTRGTDGGGMCVKRVDKLYRVRVPDPDMLFTIEHAEFWVSLGSGDCVLIHHRFPTQGGKGEIVESNHPFFSEDKKTALIHNGVVMNDSVLWKKLEKEGHKFESVYKEGNRTEITDSEVILHYLDAEHFISGAAMKRAREEIRGSMTFAAVKAYATERGVYLYRDSNPIYTYEDSDGNMYFSSQLPECLSEVVKSVKYLDSGGLYHMSLEQGVVKLGQYDEPMREMPRDSYADYEGEWRQMTVAGYWSNKKNRYVPLDELNEMDGR